MSRALLQQALDALSSCQPMVNYGLVSNAVIALQTELARTTTGMVLVPVKPTPGKLMSMAIRYDHALGCPGYYDNPAFGESRIGAHASRLESVMKTMKQLCEEVVGTGFYSVEKEDEYAAMIEAAKAQP